MSTIAKSILAAGAAAFALSLATAPMALAGPKGPQNIKNGQDLPKTDHPKFNPHKHDKHDGHLHKVWPKIAIGAAAAYAHSLEHNQGCGYYKKKYWKTGSDYWLDKYYACKSW